MKYREIKLENNKSVLVDEIAICKTDELYLSSIKQNIKPKCEGVIQAGDKIIATINHSIDLDVPMVVVEDEVEKLALDDYNTAYPSYEKVTDYKVVEKFRSIQSYIRGFKASQQKCIYSEEEMKEALYKMYSIFMDADIKSKMEALKGFETIKQNIIQSLNQEYIELETESDTIEIDFCRMFNIEIGCALDKCKCEDNTLLRMKTNRVAGQLMAYVKK